MTVGLGFGSTDAFPSPLPLRVRERVVLMVQD
jgi:hypothetical protein